MSDIRACPHRSADRSADGTATSALSALSATSALSAASVVAGRPPPQLS
ncbi:hypothetical protein ABZ825_32975 [Streptomyces tauricus]